MSQSALDTHAEVRKLKQAGCPEEQAVAMVKLVSRAPLNAQIAGGLEQVQLRLESIEAGMAGLATKSALEALSLRMESIEATMAGLATKSELQALSLRVESIEATMAGLATKSALEALSLRVESIEATMAGLATKSALEALSLRVESIEATMATKSDLAVLGAETKAALKDLRSEMFRMIWLQGGALATLILGLALS